MSETINHEYLRYVAEVAETLRPLAAWKTSYGEHYIAKVTFGFDGEDDAQLAIIPDEFGGLGVEVIPTCD